MLKKPNLPPDAAELRRRAEDRQKKQQPHTAAALSETDTQRLVHELQVHQIELEMQNEELQKARDELEVALEKYSDLYDFAPVGYMTLNREGTIEEANLTAAGLLGIERSRLIQRRLGRSVLPADLGAFDDFLTRAFESKVREFCEVTLLREGKPPSAVRIEAEVAEPGSACRAVMTDISERRRAEMDRLILSKLESTGILAGGIAHDFNNLLTVIFLNLHLARETGCSGDKLARILDETKKTALTARGLTQQLITFASGGAPVQKPIPLSGVIHESARPAVSGSRVRCEFSLAEDLWWVKGDEGQIGQVIRNLILNAREAMPEGGTVSVRAENVVLGIRANQSLPPGDYVRVSIADKGTGIADDVLPKVFDPYFSTKQRGAQRGMGLGLTICHAIVQKHGGAIAVTSRVGFGTTVHIELPSAGRQRRETHSPVLPAPGRHGRILVMDDELALRLVLRKTLHRMGHEVEAVEDGQRAIETYTRAKDEGRPFDLLILDLTVPDGLGGLETIQALLKLDPSVKAIVTSGYSADPVMLESERHGFKGVLEKPFLIESLGTLVDRLLESCPIGTAAP